MEVSFFLRDRAGNLIIVDWGSGYIQLVNQWRFFFVDNKRFNHPLGFVHIEYMRDILFKEINFTFIILGLGFYFAQYTQ